MTEQSTEGTTPTPTQDQEQLPTPAPAPTPTPDPVVVANQVTPDATGSGRYCVYDLTLTQYVSAVLDKKPTATEAKAMVPKGHKVEVREV